jgi:hypothetical protein
LAAYQEAENSKVKQQVKKVQERDDINNAEITNAVAAEKEKVNAMQERLSKVKGISHELLLLNSSVQQIQQRLDKNASKASRQLRKQGRQKKQKVNNDQSKVQKRSQAFKTQKTKKSGEVQFRGVEIVSKHCIEENHESSVDFVENVTGSVVKILHPRTDKEFDSELTKTADVTCYSTDKYEVQTQGKHSNVDPRDMQEKDLTVMVGQSNPKILKVSAKMKEKAEKRKSKERKVRFKWQPQIGDQVLPKRQPVSDAVKRLYEVAPLLPCGGCCCRCFVACSSSLLHPSIP